MGGSKRPATLIEKILASRAGRGEVRPGEIVEIGVDARLARDFGGANVVRRLEEAGLGVEDPSRTFFTLDCNPTGCDQGYAANQHRIRLFARAHGIRVYDINRGIGTHLALEEGLVRPGGTLVSTDSHANIVGAAGIFGQGMGDQDIAYAFARGKVWFQVPPTVKVVLRGRPGPLASAKDVGLALLRKFGAAGLLGKAAEITGEWVEEAGLEARLTVASLATEMGAIAALFEPNRRILEELGLSAGEGIGPDPGCGYEDVVEVDIRDLGPLVSRPGSPQDVVPIEEVRGTPVDSAFIGSCTNGRLGDLRAALEALGGRKAAPGVVLKVVPATDRVWREALAEGIVAGLKEAGALFSNAGCAGCAAGQVGQTGPGEVEVSTGNRNFPGKQGKGQVWLASPAVAAASAAAGFLTDPAHIPEKPVSVAVRVPPAEERKAAREEKRAGKRERKEPPLVVEGRVWVIPRENVDTDMIFHNRHLAVTDPAEMGKYALGNLPGWEDFPEKARPGDILAAGANFGAGSSRQQAVDCFKALGIAAILAPSFGAIYERNAVNSALPVLRADLVSAGLESGEEIRVDFTTGEILRKKTGERIQGSPMSEVQLEIYRRGGLLSPREEE